MVYVINAETQVNNPVSPILRKPKTICDFQKIFPNFPKFFTYIYLAVSGTFLPGFPSPFRAGGSGIHIYSKIELNLDGF